MFKEYFFNAILARLQKTQNLSHLDLALAPSVVDVHHGQSVPFPRLELVLDAMLVPLSLHLHRRQDQAVANKVSRVPGTLGSPEAVEVRLLSLNVHRVDGVEAKAGAEREAVLVRPLGERWDEQGGALLAGE